MVGAIVFVVVMALGVPVGIMFGGAVWSALFGWIVSDQAEQAEQTAETAEASD